MGGLKTRAWAPWSQRVSDAVALYQTELETGDFKALRREMRDGRSDAKLRRLFRKGEAVPRADVRRLVQFYRDALWDHYEAIAIADAKRVAAADDLAEAWARKIRNGEVDPNRLILIWRTRRDDRVRPAHRDMEGVAIVWGDAWVLENGDLVLRPPYGYNCRCWVQYVVLDRAPTFNADGSVKLPRALKEWSDEVAAVLDGAHGAAAGVAAGVPVG